MDIEEIRDLVTSEKKEKDNRLTSSIESKISEQYESQRQELSTNEDFQNLSREIVERSAKASLAKDMLDILDQEQKNNLSAYVLELEKEKLDFRRKREKKIVIEEVKADIANRKIQALKNRYGYLYSDKEPFIPNKSYNRHREMANWWNGTSDNFKKIIKGTLKFLLWGAIGTLVVYFGYQGISWLIKNTSVLTQV